MASNYYGDAEYDQFYPSYEYNPVASTTSTQKVSTQRIEKPSSVGPQYYSYYSTGPKSPQYTTSGSGSSLSSTIASVKSAVKSVLNKVKRFRSPPKNNNNRISNLIESPIERFSGLITQSGINRQINAIGGTNVSDQSTQVRQSSVTAKSSEYRISHIQLYSITTPTEPHCRWFAMLESDSYDLDCSNLGTVCLIKFNIISFSFNFTFKVDLVNSIVITDYYIKRSRTIHVKSGLHVSTR